MAACLESVIDVMIFEYTGRKGFGSLVNISVAEKDASAPSGVQRVQRWFWQHDKNTKRGDVTGTRRTSEKSSAYVVAMEDFTVAVDGNILKSLIQYSSLLPMHDYPILWKVRV